MNYLCRSRYIFNDHVFKVNALFSLDSSGSSRQTVYCSAYFTTISDISVVFYLNVCMKARSINIMQRIDTNAINERLGALQER